MQLPYEQCNWHLKCHKYQRDSASPSGECEEDMELPEHVHEFPVQVCHEVDVTQSSHVPITITQFSTKYRNN
jgi:hypothetical protein